MSKLKRLLGALSLVALFIFSSCVDDEVAPEVAALRQAQVALLNAEVAFQDAETRLMAAMAESQEITNTYASASNAIDLQLEQVGLDSAVANLGVQLAQAEADLATAQLEAQEASADLARAIATAGLEDAAAYLEQWNAVVFGGFTPAADGHLIFGGDGLLDTQQKIVAQKAEVAEAELYLGTGVNDDVTQAYVDAKLDVALTEAQADLAAAEANLPVQKEVLAALEADDRLAAIAALQASLIPLAADSVEAIAAVEAAQAALKTLEDIDDPNEQIVFDFQELDVATNFPQPNRDTWRSSFARDSAARANTAVFEGEITAWEDYADSLQAIYDEFYPVFVEDYETTLAEFEADTVETWNNLPNNDAGAEELFDLEDAYAAYMIELGLFNAKAVDSDGNPPTSADTTALIAARTSFDGLNAAQLLANPRVGGPFLLPLFNAATNAGTFFTWMDPPTALQGARASGVGTGNGVGGALAAYITASGNDGTAQDLHDDAVRRFEAVNTYYGNIVNEYRGLQTYIDAVKAGTEATGEYTGSVPDAPLSLTNFSGIEFMVEYSAAIKGSGADLLALLTKLGLDKTTSTAIYTALFGPDIADPSGSTPPPADPSVAKSKSDLANETTVATKAASDLTYAISIVGQDEIDAYLAALDALDQTFDSQDAYFLELVPARLAVDAAMDAQAAIATAQVDVRKQIMAIEVACDEFEVNDDNFTECGASITEQITAVKATITMLEGDDTVTGSIAELGRSVEAAGIAITLAAQGQMTAEDMVAELQAELEALQTQETVLQALADELQALLLAALAG